MCALDGALGNALLEVAVRGSAAELLQLGLHGAELLCLLVAHALEALVLDKRLLERRSQLGVVPHKRVLLVAALNGAAFVFLAAAAGHHAVWLGQQVLQSSCPDVDWAVVVQHLAVASLVHVRRREARRRKQTD